MTSSPNKVKMYIPYFLGLTIDTYIAALLLSVFTFKFTLDAQQNKDQIFELYYMKD